MYKYLASVIPTIGKMIDRLIWFFDLRRPNGGLSSSKLYLWLMNVAVVMVLLHDITNIAAVIGASIGQVLATANYALRRNSQKEAKISDEDKAQG